jgi:hypothetical protein
MDQTGVDTLILATCNIKTLLKKTVTQTEKKKKNISIAVSSETKKKVKGT